MATRKAIHRIGPQKTSFVDSLFAKDLGGFNWRFDQKGTIVRRPGQERIAKAMLEAEAYSARGLQVSLNLSGSYGLGVFRSTSVLADSKRADAANTFVPSNVTYPSPVEHADSFPQEELKIFGSQLYSMRETLIGSAGGPYLAHLLTTVVNGSKSTTVRDLGGAITALTVATDTSSIGAYSPALLNALSATNSDVFDAANIPLFFSCGEAVAGYVLAPFLDFNNAKTLNVSYAGSLGGRMMHCLVPQYEKQNPSVQMVSVQLGSKLYIAGMGGPLQCFDGLRCYAAGAPRLLSGGSTALTGTGITGTYKYKILRRIYSPDGSFTDSPSIEPTNATVSPANQTVRITLPDTGDSHRASFTEGSVIDGANAGSLVPMYKTTSWSIGSTPSTTRVNFTVPRVDLRPGEIAVFSPTSSSAGFGTRIPVATTNQEAGLAYATFIPTTVPSGATVLSAGDAWVILRTVNGGTDQYYERAVIANGTTTFDDAMSDATMTAGSSVYLETAYDRGPPPSQTGAIAAHQQRIVVAGSSLVTESDQTQLSISIPRMTAIYWSEPFTEHFPGENEISLEGLCNKITGLASINDILYILTDKGIWAITGTLIDPTTFTLQRLTGAFSCSSPASVVVDEENVWFVDKSGKLARISGLSVEAVYDLQELDKADQTSPAGSGSLLLEESTACLNTAEDNIYFFLPKGFRTAIIDNGGLSVTAGQYLYYYPSYVNRESFASEIEPEESICLVYDRRRKIFYRYKGIVANGGAVEYKGKTVVAYRDASGLTMVRQLNPLCSFDDGTAITMQVTAPFEDADSPHLEKVFSRLCIYAPDATSEFALGVTVEKDWDERHYIQNFTKNFRVGEGYAVEPYAVDGYGDANFPTAQQDLLPVKAKSLRIILTHEDTEENPVINGWTLEYSDIARENREE